MPSGKLRDKQSVLLLILVGVAVVVVAVLLYSPARSQVTNQTSNTATNNLMPDVRVVSELAEHTSGYIFVIHWLVWGNVMNVGNATSRPVVLMLQITTPDGAPLLTTNTTAVPDVLSPKQVAQMFLPNSLSCIQPLRSILFICLQVT